ncbi:TPA: phage tail protein [Providencia rettgeri]
MSKPYYSILTTIGENLVAKATALGTKLDLTTMAVGDGNGKLPAPDPAQTKLINEKRRAAVNSLEIDKNNPNIIIVEHIIPETEGGWWVREIGLFDSEGNLIAVGNCPETYKPKMIEGSGRTQIIRMMIVVKSTECIELKADPSVVLATREYVDNIIESFPAASENEAGKVKLTSVASESEEEAITPLALFKENKDRKQFENKLTEADIHRILALTKQTKMGQKSLMSKIKAIMTPTGMYARSENGELYVGICMGDGYYPSAVEYRFVLDIDGLLQLRGVRSGLVSSGSQYRLAAAPEFVDESITSISLPNVYTTKVGAEVRGKVKTNRFIFKSFQDKRGGSWLITLKNKVTKIEKTISVWRSEEASAIEIDVFGEIPYAEYDYIMKFVGKDPYNEPSDGTARGWLYYDPNDAAKRPIITCRLNPLNHATAKWLVPVNTIIDFAISAKPDEYQEGSTWTPSHSGIAGVTVNTNRKVYLDGVMIDNSLSSIPDLPMTEIRSFRIDQQFDAKHANVATLLWHQWVTHNIMSDGELSITNKLEFRAKTWVSNAYLAMLAAKTDSFSRLVYDDGQEFSPLKADGSTEFYPYGAQSAMYAGYYDENKGLSHGIVAEVNPQEACNWLTPYQPAMTVRQENRTDQVTKTYWPALNNISVQAGTVIKNQTRYYCVSGVRSPNNELKVI